MRFRLISLFIIVLLAIPVLAQDDDPLIGEAFVSSVTIEETDDGIIIEISGDLADACTELGEITQSVEDDTIFVSVPTTRDAEAMCAMVLTAFETDYELDTSEIEPGDYTLDVNGITEEITISATDDSDDVELTCPEADDDTVLYEEENLCFVYPAEFDELAGNGFILINQPLTANAILLINIEDVEDITLDDLAAEFEDEEIVAEELVIGGEDALIVETEISRTAYVIAHEQVYTFFVQPLHDEDDTAEMLWSTVIDSVFFPESDEE